MKITGFLLAFTLLQLPAAAHQGHLAVEVTPYACDKGAARLVVDEAKPGDSLHIAWSAGQVNVRSIDQLDLGEYSVRVYLRERRDSLFHVTDTTLRFRIEKVECPMSVPRYFSPNGDNYNDLLQIANADRHPNFEFEVFNKWGQRVHHQRGTFTPWDGKWLGIDLPDGAYYFILFYDASDKKKFEKGDITILR